MPRKSPRAADSQSPASASRRSSRIASLTKEEATPPRASRALAESPSGGKSRAKTTPVKAVSKASPRTPTSQKRGTKRKTEESLTVTSKRGRRSARKHYAEEDEEAEEEETNEEDKEDAGPSGDTDAAGDKTDEVKSEEADEPMETEDCKEAGVKCPTIKITPPVEETKVAVADELPMETACKTTQVSVDGTGGENQVVADKEEDVEPDTPEADTDSEEKLNSVGVEQAEKSPEAVTEEANEDELKPVQVSPCKDGDEETEKDTSAKIALSTENDITQTASVEKVDVTDEKAEVTNGQSELTTSPAKEAGKQNIESQSPGGISVGMN